MTNQIVVTRPGYPVDVNHIPENIREHIVDLREGPVEPVQISGMETKIYISDAVKSNTSASRIRTRIKENLPGWRNDVPEKVANYIEKYELYT
jgi:nicotinic acid mononucleotide adenylyltransferase